MDFVETTKRLKLRKEIERSSIGQSNPTTSADRHSSYMEFQSFFHNVATNLVNLVRELERVHDSEIADLRQRFTAAADDKRDTAGDNLAVAQEPLQIVAFTADPRTSNSTGASLEPGMAKTCGLASEGALMFRMFQGETS